MILVVSLPLLACNLQAESDSSSTHDAAVLLQQTAAKEAERRKDAELEADLSMNPPPESTTGEKIIAGLVFVFVVVPVICFASRLAVKILTNK